MTDFRIERIPFDGGALGVWAAADPRRNNWPVVYAIDDSNEIYVGETTNVGHRMAQHLQSPSKKHLRYVRVVIDETFNKSVCLDLESQLISYFAGDGKYQVLNRNLGITDADYFERDKYRRKFTQLFEELTKEGMLTRSIPDIVNSDLFKYSPFKALNTDQAVAIEGILEALFSDLETAHAGPIVVEGEPGTGKTIVAVYLMKLLVDIQTSADDDLSADSMFSDFFQSGYRELLQDFKVGFVIPQQSLRKSMQKVFRRTPGLKHVPVMKQTEAASGDYFDLLVVDETHRLWQRANQPSASENQKFRDINERLFGKDAADITQLDWLRKVSRHQIFLVDANQTVRPGDLPRSVLDALTTEARLNQRLFHLASQMRVSGGNDYIRFVRDLLSPSPVQSTQFGDYEFEMFDDFNIMRQRIAEKEDDHGLARIVAGYAWPWSSKNNKSEFDIEIDGVQMRWNSTTVDWVNSPNSFDEVGSIHTVQGYDLNYAGVVIGNDLAYDPENRTLMFKRQHYFDKKGKENNKQLGIKYSDEDLLGYVVNIYRVLMTRGIRGTYLYVCDPQLREFLRHKIGSSSS